MRVFRKLSIALFVVLLPLMLGACGDEPAEEVEEQVEETTENQ